MTLNIDALREAVAWAEAEAAKPNGSWDQENWASGTVTPDPGDAWSVVCGTAFCIAGHLCAAAGDTFVIRTSYLIDVELNGSQEVSPDEVVPHGGSLPMPVLQRARQLLGVEVESLISDGLYGVVSDEEHAMRTLFNAANTIEDVRSIATQIATRHGYTL